MKVTVEVTPEQFLGETKTRVSFRRPDGSVCSDLYDGVKQAVDKASTSAAGWLLASTGTGIIFLYEFFYGLSTRPVKADSCLVNLGGEVVLGIAALKFFSYYQKAADDYTAIEAYQKKL